MPSPTIIAIDDDPYSVMGLFDEVSDAGFNVVLKVISDDKAYPLESGVPIRGGKGLPLTACSCNVLICPPVRNQIVACRAKSLRRSFPMTRPARGIWSSDGGQTGSSVSCAAAARIRS